MLYIILGLLSGLIFWLVTLTEHQRASLHDLVEARLANPIDDMRYPSDAAAASTRRELTIAGLTQITSPGHSGFDFVSAYALSPSTIEDLAHREGPNCFNDYTEELKETLIHLQEMGCVRGFEVAQLISNKAPIPAGQSLFVALVRQTEAEYEIYAFVAPSPP